MKIISILIYISILTYLPGCTWLTDSPRTFWGSSVRVLSGLREQGDSAEFQCLKDACFEAVLGLTAPFGSADASEKFVLFAKDAQQNYLIIMGITDSVDTTEVGIFFDALPDGRTRVGISSLSSRARHTASQAVFERLSQEFGSLL